MKTTEITVTNRFGSEILFEGEATLYTREDGTGAIEVPATARVGRGRENHPAVVVFNFKTEAERDEMLVNGVKDRAGYLPPVRNSRNSTLVAFGTDAATCDCCR